MNINPSAKIFNNYELTETRTMPLEARTVPTEAWTMPMEARTMPMEAWTMPMEAWTMPMEAPDDAHRSSDADRGLD
jgi:hypothetical protein